MKNLKRLFICLMVLALSVCSVPIASAASSTVTYANLVVFVDFADTTHSHTDSSWGNCYSKSASDTLQFFNGSSSDKRGLKTYLETITYGEKSVNNIMPQYDGTNITALTLSNNTDYYTDGSMGLDDALVLSEVIAWLKLQNLSSYNLDGNNDGALDNLTVVVPYEYGSSHTNVRGHKSVYAGSTTLNGDYVRSYTIIPEYGLYFSMMDSGLLIHEFLHTFGMPDLYTEDGSGAVPVGLWDIMASDSRYVQYPLAYMRSKYLESFTIPTVTQSTSNYSIYAASTASSTTKNNQAVILKTDYSDSEFFVVEYRKQSSNAVTSTEYEKKIPGSGIIIYRVDTKQTTNMAGSPYYIYVFREDDDITKSFFSSESGRTSFSGLTYSDGTNSGITIKNIGSATGNTISFDINYGNISTDYWKTEVEKSSTSVGATSYFDGVNQYFVDTTSTSLNLLKYENNSLENVSSLSVKNAESPMLFKIDNNYYVTFRQLSSDYSYYNVFLYNYDGSVWSKLKTMTTTYDYTASCEGNILYIGTVSEGNTYDSASFNVVKYDTTSNVATSLGTVNSTGYPGAVTLTCLGGKVVAAYRSAFDGNKVCVSMYNSGWKSVGTINASASSINLAANNDLIYLLLSNDQGVSAWTHSLSTSGSWTSLGSKVTSDGIIESRISFIGDTPIIAYQTSNSENPEVYVKELSGSTWKNVGSKVYSGSASCLSLNTVGNTIFVSLLSPNNNLLVKTHKVLAGYVTLPKNKVYINKGETINVSVVGANATGRVNIVSENDNVATVGTSTLWLEDDTQTFSVTGHSHGTVGIMVNLEDVSDDLGNEVTGTLPLTVEVHEYSNGVCSVCGAYDKTYKGLVKKDGEWIYIKNGKFDSTYTGLSKNQYGYRYVVNGKFVESKTGLIKMPSTSDYQASKYIYIKAGKFMNSYTGIMKNGSYGYRYVVKGVWDSTKTGLLKMPAGTEYKAGKYVYIKAGKFMDSYTGIMKNGSYGYRYVVKGVWSEVTGLIQMPKTSEYQASKWVYIEAGKFTQKWTGIATNKYGKRYVKNSVFASSFSGKVKYNNKTYTIKNGKVV